MCCINTGRLELKLEVVPVESLLPHEATFPHIVNKLILEFTNLAKLQNPIIIDENDILLDGNHRAFVFKKLHFKYISVCKINYFNKNVKLRYWYRLLKNIKSFDLLKQIIEDMNGSVTQVTDKKTLTKVLENNSLNCGIQQGDFYAAISFNKDIVNDAVSAYDFLEKIQNKLIKEGIELKYIPDQYVHERKFCNELKDNEVVIWTPQITKEMVIDAAKKGKVFAPRTTRNLIPSRPINVNVPSHWFKENILLEEINKRFSTFLESKQVKRFGPGQIIDGRYYGEELFIYFDKK
ncbi:MAG: hypothetical protein JRI72_10565 [Deltaproteobacteria bacterium]|jgi:hypothetical protein|nr:hypothetical protein [Deltaproteobacteria bacterium]